MKLCLQYHEQVYKYVSTLKSLLFTGDINLHILEVFQQFCAHPGCLQILEILEILEKPWNLKRSWKSWKNPGILLRILEK